MQFAHRVSTEETGKVKKILLVVPVAILLLPVTILLLPAAILSLAPTASVHAQSGCADSPENPTVVFGLISAAASFGVMHFRKRSGSRDK
jgi:XrtJ-associated TM-motif-TM protein